MSEAMREGSEFEVRIHGLAFGGRGVGRTEDGMVVFVEGGLPGATVRAVVTTARKRFAEARAVAVLQPSPQAVEPFCPHYPECGGCDVQDLDYAEQLAWKRRFVADNLERLGRADPSLVAEAKASPGVTRFRNKMEFAFSGGGRTPLFLGLRRRGMGDVIPLDDCPVSAGPVAEVLGAAARLVRDSGQPAYDPATGRGLWRHLVLRSAATTGQAMVHLIVAQDPSRADTARDVARELAKAVPALTSVVLSTRKARSMVASGDKVRLVVGEDHITERLGGRAFRVSPEAFFQTNTAGAELLLAEVLDAAALTGSETVWDLYCGGGGLTLPLARRSLQVIGFEQSSQALADAEANAEANKVTNVRFVPGDVAATVRGAVGAPEVVVVDPPRSGLVPGVVKELLKAAAPRLVYVSCNPGTLGRDVGLLGSAYRVSRSTPVDLFPHTGHVESVTLLERLK